ncbi:MAG: hypothetical protein ACLRRA_02690 [Acutalibacteraceae bacterium]
MKKKKMLRNTILCSAAALLLVASLTAAVIKMTQVLLYQKNPPKQCSRSQIRKYQSFNRRKQSCYICQRSTSYCLYD